RPRFAALLLALQATVQRLHVAAFEARDRLELIERRGELSLRLLLLIAGILHPRHELLALGKPKLLADGDAGGSAARRPQRGGEHQKGETAEHGEPLAGRR